MNDSDVNGDKSEKNCSWIA
uniref:Uncharacterized protein n=1 Tax=Rhizophora mucronata TaxID=61149 RepID=A0A2P2IN96_RHIMU